MQGKVDMILGLLDQTGRKVHPSFRGKLEAFLKHATILQAATLAQPAGGALSTPWWLCDRLLDMPSALPGCLA